MSENTDAAMDDIMASLREAVTIPEVVSPVVPVSPSVAAPPVVARDITLEALVRTALEPLLKAWLDANLPEIVDRAAQAEIARLTGRE